MQQDPRGYPPSPPRHFRSPSYSTPLIVLTARALPPKWNFSSQVTLSEKKGQAVRVGSHCLWNPSTDNYSSAFLETADMFCCCSVFGLYYE